MLMQTDFNKSMYDLANIAYINMIGTYSWAVETIEISVHHSYPFFSRFLERFWYRKGE